MTATAPALGPRVATARWPWLVLGLFVALAVIAMSLVVANEGPILEQVGFVIAFGLFGLVGAMICSREPRNRIGILLLYGSSATATSFTAGETMTLLVLRGRSDLLVTQLLAVLGNVGWIVGILPVLFLLGLLFPTGRIPSARWRPVLWVAIGSLVVTLVLLLFGLPELTGSTDAVAVPNPFYLAAFDASFLDMGVGFLFVVVLALCASALVVRFRGSSGVERQQIKWVAAAGLLLVLSAVLSQTIYALGREGPVVGLVDILVNVVGFTAIPVSIGVAVLRFHLYDLDVVIRKTLVVAVLTVAAVLVYAGVVAAGTALLGRDDPTLGAVAAVLLALGFQPARAWSRRAVDRLVYGGRATPYEVLSEFSERVGDAYATDDVLGRMARILGEGVGAQTARVWLNVGNELRPASTWPPEAAPTTPVAVAGSIPSSVGEESVVEVRDRGELLGALSMAMPANDPMTPAREKLVRDLASQAGLALRNVRLVEELRAAQRRLVAAQDHERRRIERNIHDGAQQQLVALTVKMRLAQSLASTDGEKTAAMLEQMQAETQTALEDLRDLARGIYPPLLADQGLAAALEAQARKSPMPVEVAPDGVGRYPQEVEAAVYFSVLEALQNVAKYAGASRASVRLGLDGGWLTFVVEDDGAGFDPRTTTPGTGLQGIADRLAVLDGAVDVSSEPGAGTIVRGRVPIMATSDPRTGTGDGPGPG